MKTMSILLVDDHAMFRSGLRIVIGASMPNATVVEAGSLEQALANEMEAPAVVLLDIRLPGQNGMDGIALLKRRWPAVPVLMLSSVDAPATVRKALACGAAGFVSKAETAERIVELIDRAVNGQLAMPAAGDGDQHKLSPRQREVLDLVCQGLANKLIARRLDVAENTVRRHVQDILAHFQVATRTEAVFAARQQGLAD